MEINYYDYEELVKHFWLCSIKKDFSSFDFYEAFESLRAPIHNKLAENSQLSYQEYVEQIEEVGYEDKKVLRSFVVENNYYTISEDDLLEAIHKKQYRIMKDALSGYSSFEELKEILEAIDSIEDKPEEEKVLLLDRCIHAEHETGTILDLNIGELRSEFEKEQIIEVAP